MKPAALLVLASALAHAQSYSFTQFDVPGAASTYAVAINNAGQILGVFSDSQGAHCFLRSPDGATFINLGQDGHCSGLNNLGQIVGSQGLNGYIRDASGQLTTFAIPAAGPSTAAAINDRGEIVGTLAAPPEGGPGYLRSPQGTFTNIAAPAIGQLDPTAINNHGDIAGWALYGSSLGAQHGFFRSAAGVYRQFDLPGTTSYTRITALNNAGQFAGIMIGGPAFVSNPDGAFTLLPGYSITGIDDAGRIVGAHSDPAGTHAFIGTPVPASTAPEIRTALPGVLPASAFGGSAHNQIIAPGTWIEIFGRNLAPLTRQWTMSDFHDAAPPTSLDGVRVSIAGLPAFVSYISPGQVNAFVPSSLATGAAQVIVTNGALSTAPYAVEVAASRPAMLAMPPSLSPDTAYITALFPDFSPASAARLPRAGDTLIFIGMGFGAVSPDAVQFTFTRTAAPVSAKVLYAGPMPGTLGLYQFNIVLPDIPLLPGETSDDFVAVNISLNGAPIPSPPALMMSIAK